MPQQASLTSIPTLAKHNNSNLLSLFEPLMPQQASLTSIPTLAKHNNSNLLSLFETLDNTTYATARDLASERDGDHRSRAEGGLPAALEAAQQGAERGV